MCFVVSLHRVQWGARPIDPNPKEKLFTLVNNVPHVRREILRPEIE